LQISENILALYDDDAVTNVFDKHKDSTTGTLTPEKLPAALLDLDVRCQEPGLNGPLTLDDFKRIARQLNEAEQWIQMVQLSSLLARSIKITTLDGLKLISDPEISRGLDLFSLCAKKLFIKRMTRFREQEAKLQVLKTVPGNTKFGTCGYTMKGGNVDDFFKGLPERIGKLSYLV